MNLPMPNQVRELLEEYSERARTLGQRTGELHVALAYNAAPPEFAPEPFSDHYRQGLYHGMLGQAARAIAQLRQQLPALRPEMQNEARRLLAREEQIRDRFRTIRDRRVSTSRLRIHGDMNLSQVLYTGRDFAFIDFEGQPSRPYSERRIKRSPLRDVAGMLRSMQYAAYAVLFGHVPGVTTRPEAAASLEAWAGFWWSWASARYLEGYLAAARDGGFLPADHEELRVLLDAYLLDKALRELQVELSYRPEWAMIPLRGIANILDA
jgi:maltose alpha-D-glucosyltransferase/alpha-amylase